MGAIVCLLPIGVHLIGHYTDLSDYNSLKNQYDPSSIVKKYEKRNLKTKPTELQNYYKYLDKSGAVLDELNYISERMKTEDLQKFLNYL